MKYVFARFTAAIVMTSSLVLVACYSKPNEVTGLEKGSVRVLMPMSNSSRGNSLDTFLLQGIEDLQTVAGRFVHFFMSPAIVDNKLHGASPKARFIRNTDGTYVPTDELSQQLVAIYAHMQRLAALDEELGVGSINKWPRDIGVLVRVQGGMKNNAFYDNKTDSLLFVPYINSGLPIAINGGILAHEHFHSLFYKTAIRGSIAQIHNRADFIDESYLHDDGLFEEEATVTVSQGDALTEEEKRLFYHKAMIRGLNEGFADFWGWMYTGNPDFIALSLPKEKLVRSLEVPNPESIKSLPSENRIKITVEKLHNHNKDKKDRKKFEDYITGYAYELGTQFSRLMKRFTDIYAENRNIDKLKARKEIARVLLNVLPDIKEDFQNLGSNYYNAIFLLNSFLNHLDNLHANECQFLADVYNNTDDGDLTNYSCKDEAGWKIVNEPAETVVEKKGSGNTETKQDEDKISEPRSEQ